MSKDDPEYLNYTVCLRHEKDAEPLSKHGPTENGKQKRFWSLTIPGGVILRTLKYRNKSFLRDKNERGRVGVPGDMVVAIHTR